MGILRSLPAGENWYAYTSGIFYPVLYSLAISVEENPLLLAGSFGSGLYGTDPVKPEAAYLPLALD